MKAPFQKLFPVLLLLAGCAAPASEALEEAGAPSAEKSDSLYGVEAGVLCASSFDCALGLECAADGTCQPPTAGCTVEPEVGP